jgi:putative flippase GtrA
MAALRVQRWVRFNAVGGAGFVLQTTAVWLLAEQAGLHYLGAVAVALELAILHNYVWHARWTWRDRRGGGRPVRRLVQYHALAGAMALANLVCVAVLVEAWDVPYLPASALAVGICAVVNFGSQTGSCFRNEQRNGPRRDAVAVSSGSAPAFREHRPSAI